MSQATMTKCDHCGKVVVDVFAEKGWIQIATSSASGLGITRYAGRAGNNQGITDYISAKTVVDYCGVVCLVGAFDKLAAARKRKTKKAEKVEKDA